MTRHSIPLQPSTSTSQSSLQPPARPCSDQIPISESLLFESRADQPSLGYLNETLSYIAQERTRWSAARLKRSSNNGVLAQRTSALAHDLEHEHDMDAGDDTWRKCDIGDYFPFL